MASAQGFDCLARRGSVRASSTSWSRRSEGSQRSSCDRLAQARASRLVEALPEGRPDLLFLGCLLLGCASAESLKEDYVTPCGISEGRTDPSLGSYLELLGGRHEQDTSRGQGGCRLRKSSESLGLAGVRVFESIAKG